MKTSRSLLVWLSALVLATGGLFAADDTSSAPAVKVVFSHPENFTDVKDAALPTEQGRTEILNQLKQYIVDQARQYLPAGDKLTITVTDIDLAGDYEPQLSGRFQDIRIIRPIYPPKMNLSYKLSDANGNVVKQGDRNLADVNFQTRLTIDNQDPLRYEKGMIGDWLRQEFSHKS